MQANAEELPFPDNSFDCISIAFGLRNVTDKDKALASMTRCLRAGWQTAGVGIFQTHFAYMLSKVYDVYSLQRCPLWGNW